MYRVKTTIQYGSIKENSLTRKATHETVFGWEMRCTPQRDVYVLAWASYVICRNRLSHVRISNRATNEFCVRSKWLYFMLKPNDRRLPKCQPVCVFIGFRSITRFSRKHEHPRKDGLLKALSNYAKDLTTLRRESRERVNKAIHIRCTQ